jgi:alpha-ribazole phosphatase
MAEGLCYGHHDVPLAASFADEARAIVAQLPWVPVETWSSPAERCQRLARVLAKGAVTTDPRLAELHMGRWEGCRWEELRGPEVDAWFADPWHARPPGGETVPELLARVGELQAEWRRRRAERCVLVTHAGVIRAWRSLCEKRPLAELMAEAVPLGSLWSIDGRRLSQAP